MINPFEIMETINMVDNEHLDIRTITMGISLLDCILWVGEHLACLIHQFIFVFCIVLCSSRW